MPTPDLKLAICRAGIRAKERLERKNLAAVRHRTLDRGLELLK